MSPLAPFMCFALAATVALPALASDVVWVSRFDDALSETGQAEWEVGGELAALHPMLGGDVIGLVATGNGGLALVRWGHEGTEKGRWPTEARGPVAASRVLADGSVVVVAAGQLLRLSPSGQTLARRPLEYSVDEEFKTWVAAAPGGAWVATGPRVAFFGFDGSEVDVKLPPWESEEKTAEPRATRLFVTEDGECLVAQPRRREFEIERYAPPDRTDLLLLAMVSARGEVMATKKLGTVRRSLEWFWKKYSGRDNLFPNIGLVRFRYGGGAALLLAGERPGGSLLLFLEEDAGRLAEVDRRLEERWTSAYARDMAEAFSPPWAAKQLVFTGTAVTRLGALGQIEKRQGMRIAEKLEVSPRKGSAIGQTTTGEWLVIVWGTRAEENSR